MHLGSFSGLSALSLPSHSNKKSFHLRRVMHQCRLRWHRMIHVPYNETLHSWTWSWLFYSFTCSAPSAAFHGNLRGKNIRHSAIRISLSFPTSLNLSCLTASMLAQMPSQLPSGQHWHPSKVQAKWVTEHNVQSLLPPVHISHWPSALPGNSGLPWPGHMAELPLGGCKPHSSLNGLWV